MSKRRISDSIPVFNEYVDNTNVYLVAFDPMSGVPNWTRLGLTAQNQTDWATKAAEWAALHGQYSNPLQSTSVVKAQVRNFMEEFREFAQPLLNIMAANPTAGEADEAIFNFKIGRDEPSHPTTPIEEQVVVGIEYLGGGELKLSARTPDDDDKPSLPEGADSVQLAFHIGDNEEGHVPSPDDANMVKEIFTKAQFVFQAGPSNVGKRVVLFARWYNTKHKALAGPWSNIQAAIIA